MAKCNRCGSILEDIHYVEPDWTGFNWAAIRPPLCKPCWEIADRQERERQALKGVEIQHSSPVSMPKCYGKHRDGRIIGEVKK